jgi:two-component system KDP operon response regulator KdpE
VNGIEIIHQVRTWSSNPIIVVSARIQECDKVEALDAGADDYITKPFGTSELLARIRTSIRHSNKINTSSPLYIRPYKALGLIIDFSSHLIKLDEEELHLTPAEYKIVVCLAQNSGKVLTYSSIMKNVWGPYADESNKILRVNMANIRRKLEKNPGDPKYIFTEIGVGYRMIDG